MFSKFDVALTLCLISMVASKRKYNNDVQQYTDDHEYLDYNYGYGNDYYFQNEDMDDRDYKNLDRDYSNYDSDYTNYESDDDELLFGREVSKKDEYPFVVEIEHPRKKRSCTGTIVSALRVLTSVFCCPDSSYSEKVKVYFGSHKKSAHKYITGTPHEAWVSIENKGLCMIALDANILKTTSIIDKLKRFFTGKGVGTVRKEYIVGENENLKKVLKSGAPFIAVGFGLTNSLPKTAAAHAITPVFADVLRYGEMKWIECTDKTKAAKEHLFCMQGITPCNGDAGGPLLHKHEDGGFSLVGILTEFDLTDCTNPSATPVAYYSYLDEDWIKGMIYDIYWQYPDMDDF